MPEDKRDEVYVFLSDILPTAWHANELGQVGEGDRVAIWGAGPGAMKRPAFHSMSASAEHLRELLY